MALRRGLPHSMTWHGKLKLQYRRDGERTLAHDRHEGPLRVLAALYPEGPLRCHHVIVHPPGGIVGGDMLDVDITLQARAQALVTTPGAARFYRSAGSVATQDVRLRLDEGARLEWLPLETIVYDGAIVRNRLQFELAPAAGLMGWDILALGLPCAGQSFVHGRIDQRLAWPDRWLDEARVDASDLRLLDSSLGWDGQRVLGTMWLADGSAFAPRVRDALLDQTRELAAASSMDARLGVTAPSEGLVVARMLGNRVEPVIGLLSAIRELWRRVAWDLSPHTPRIWRT